MHQLNEQIGVLRREIARDYAPRAEQVRQRRRAVLIVVLAMVGSLLVNNGAISRCFLGPPTGLERRVCGFAFPGFEHARRENDRRLAQFLGLLEAIPANSARSKANEDKITELQRRVDRLERQRKR